MSKDNKYEKKVVMLPVSVPVDDWCWDGINPCRNFDNYGGDGKCVLNIGHPMLHKEDGTYRKPDNCKFLKTIEQMKEDSSHE